MLNITDGCTVVLRNGDRIPNVYKTACVGKEYPKGAYAYAAYVSKPSVEDLATPAMSDNVRTDRADYCYAWDIAGRWERHGESPRDIVAVEGAQQVNMNTGNYLICIDVRDNQPLMFGTNNLAISKHVQPLITQLENAYKINASLDHDGTMQDKLIENVNKLKSADMVIRFDGYWWPIRFVKTVNTLQEALECI